MRFLTEQQQKKLTEKCIEQRLRNMSYRNIRKQLKATEIDKNTIDEIMREVKRSDTTLFDAASLKEEKKMLAAKALIKTLSGAGLVTFGILIYIGTSKVGKIDRLSIALWLAGGLSLLLALADFIVIIVKRR